MKVVLIFIVKIESSGHGSLNLVVNKNVIEVEDNNALYIYIYCLRKKKKETPHYDTALNFSWLLMVIRRVWPFSFCGFNHS